MKITISKTVQVRQYEPLTVTIEDEADVQSKEEKQQLYKSVSSLVHAIIKREYAYFDSINEAPKANASQTVASVPKLKKTRAAKVVSGE